MRDHLNLESILKGQVPSYTTVLSPPASPAKMRRVTTMFVTALILSALAIYAFGGVSVTLQYV